MAHCSACGHALGEGAAFCSTCGAAVGALVPASKSTVGRTWPDIFHESALRPTLDKLTARMVGWVATAVDVAADRVKRIFESAAEKIEATGQEPLPIPERVGLSVAEAVATEDREELYELWANLLANTAVGMTVDEFEISIVRKLDPPSVYVLQYAANLFWANHKRTEDETGCDIRTHPPPGLEGLPAAWVSHSCCWYRSRGPRPKATRR